MVDVNMVSLKRCDLEGRDHLYRLLDHVEAVAVEDTTVYDTTTMTYRDFVFDLTKITACEHKMKRRHGVYLLKGPLIGDVPHNVSIKIKRTPSNHHVIIARVFPPFNKPLKPSLIWGQVETHRGYTRG
jgi:hypothetical protein